MEMSKQEMMKKMEEKGMSVSEVAKGIAFDPQLLRLYFADDAYSIPNRILEKMAGFLNN